MGADRLTRGQRREGQVPSPTARPLLAWLKLSVPLKRAAPGSIAPSLAGQAEPRLRRLSRALAGPEQPSEARLPVAPKRGRLAGSGQLAGPAGWGRPVPPSCPSGRNEQKQARARPEQRQVAFARPLSSESAREAPARQWPRHRATGPLQPREGRPAELVETNTSQSPRGWADYGCRSVTKSLRLLVPAQLQRRGWSFTITR